MREFLSAFSIENIPTLWVIVLACPFGLFKCYPKYDHKRYRNNIWILAVILSVIGTFYFLNLLATSEIGLLLTLSVAYLLILLATPIKVLFPETVPIKKLKALVSSGDYRGIDNLFPQKPWYILSPLGKIEWYKLWAAKLIRQDRVKEAYEIYLRILDIPLFDEEKTKTELNRVFILLQLGDTNKAKSIFDQIKRESESQSLFLESKFYEREGEFEKARECLLSAVGKFDNVKDIYLAKIYNDLGRMEGILGNTVNADHYYRKAAELAKEYKSSDLIHVAYPNLIDTYLLARDRKNAELYLKIYSELANTNIVDNLFKFNNYCLEYARQTGNKVLFIESLVQGRVDILPKLSKQEHLPFELSELWIRWNNQYNWEEKLFWFQHYFSEYRKLEFPARYHAIKTVFNILDQLAKANNLGPFVGLYIQLLEFLEESKENIDQYLLDSPDVCVNERCIWEDEKVFLRRIKNVNDLPMQSKDLKNYCEGVFKHLRNIKDIHLQHGNPLEAIRADLNIADECMGIMPMAQEENSEPYLKDAMKEHLDEACRNLDKFKRHPASNEFFLRVARYALFQGDVERAKKYFDAFIQSKISINHYAAWLQTYYHELCAAIPTEVTL